MRATFLTAEKQEQQDRGVRSRQVDTNVVAVTFDTLSGPSGVHTGDVVVCANQQCTAVLSHLSKVTEGEPASDQKVCLGLERVVYHIMHH